jgi:hypothetical protein
MVYVTSQNNIAFDGIDANALIQKLDKLKTLVTDTTMPADKKLESWWIDECALYAEHNKQVDSRGFKRKESTIKNSNQKIELAWSGGKKRVNALCFQRDRGTVVKEIDTLKAKIGRVTTILDQNIFRKAPEKAGFHGESRVLRHLFIIYATAKIIHYSSANTTMRHLLDNSRETSPTPASAAAGSAIDCHRINRAAGRSRRLTSGMMPRSISAWPAPSPSQASAQGYIWRSPSSV